MKVNSPNSNFHVVVLAAMLFLSACSPYDILNVMVPEETFSRKTDISYGTKPRHRLDVYTPATLKSKTVVVFLYGGSWKRGKKKNYYFAGAAFASRGFITVVPDYRVYPTVKFPGFIEDAAAAVQWVRLNIGKYGGDPNRIVLVGHSAGAHIASFLALDKRFLTKAKVPQKSIKGVIGLAGPYAFNPLEYSSVRPIFENAPNPKDIRPINFARAGAPPMLLMHGVDDGLVAPENSQALAAKLLKFGVDADYVPLEETGHLGVLLGLAKPFDKSSPVIQLALRFIDRFETQLTALPVNQANTN